MQTICNFLCGNLRRPKTLRAAGPNALALPSGIMVITDEMVRDGEATEGLGAFAYVSTHPVTAERVRRARNAAAESQ